MKTILLTVATTLGLVHSAGAYSLAGPIGNGGDAWQAPVIGYNYPGSGDVVAPKNIGEEYRRNTPVLYYAYNANFLDYFGSNGIVAVDGAFTILNGLTNVSSYSTSLSEFPLESKHFNYEAQALGLFDLKSVTLGIMMEQSGLADPVRFTWTLHDRFHVTPGPACPLNMEYLVVQRNFDYVSSPLNQLQYSPYVNDTLLSYQIIEFCTGPNPLALSVPFSVDPLADTYSPVASSYGGFIYQNTSLGLLFTASPGIYAYGAYYTSLTRDDVAGLRYLLKTNNINFEDPATGAQLITITTNLLSQIPFPPNPNSPSGFGTFDLNSLLSAAKTNDPATLLLLFPGVIVATSSNFLTVVATPNVVATFKTVIGAPAGSAPKLVVVTNGFTYSSQTNYVTTFANIVTNHVRLNPTAILQTITVAPVNGAPLGSPSITNITTKTVTLTNVFGDYYFLAPDNCPLNLLKVLYTNVTVTTNILTVVNTNIVTASNTTTFSFTQTLVTSFTNFAFLANPVTCAQVPAGPGLYQGIENIKYVRTSFDSLLGQFFQPITNNYTMITVTNSQARLQCMQRIITTPDLQFSAADLASGPGAIPVVFTFTRNVNFDTAQVLPQLAGPGTINPASTITFDKVGPVYFNGTTFIGDVLDGTPAFTETPGGDVADTFYLAYFVWASFDGTTNAPVVYPNGTSIDNLQNQIFVQVTPTTLPLGANGAAFPPTMFHAAGGAFTGPFTWSLAFGSALPNGITLSPDGTLSGTPTQSGTFDFILQLTDSLGRSMQLNYTLVVQ